MNDLCQVFIGDCRETLKDVPDKSVQMCVTSPPYFGLRDYGESGQIGLENTLEGYIENLKLVTDEVYRVLKDDGVLWLNLGDSYSSGNRPRASIREDTYRAPTKQSIGAGAARPPQLAGIKPKDLIGVPWQVALAMRDSGWYLRTDIIWSKPNAMPESVTDRPTKSHEYIFLLTKSEHYFYDHEAIKEKAEMNRWGGDKPMNMDNTKDVDNQFAGLTRPRSMLYETRNKRSVWTINTTPYKDAHFATFPEEIPRLCILAGSKAGDTILDPFAGSGTTGKVAVELGRKAILCELNPDYRKLIEKRTTTTRGFAI